MPLDSIPWPITRNRNAGIEGPWPGWRDPERSSTRAARRGTSRSISSFCDSGATMAIYFVSAGDRAMSAMRRNPHVRHLPTHGQRIGGLAKREFVLRSRAHAPAYRAGANADPLAGCRPRNLGLCWSTAFPTTVWGGICRTPMGKGKEANHPLPQGDR